MGKVPNVLPAFVQLKTWKVPSSRVFQGVLCTRWGERTSSLQHHATTWISCLLQHSPFLHAGCSETSIAISESETLWKGVLPNPASWFPFPPQDIVRQSKSEEYQDCKYPLNYTHCYKIPTFSVILLPYDWN